MAFSRSWSIEFCRVYEVLTILLHRSIHRLKFSLKSVNLCKLTARCTDVHSDKPHPRFDMKILSKKVQLTGFSNLKNVAGGNCEVAGALFRHDNGGLVG